MSLGFSAERVYLCLVLFHQSQKSVLTKLWERVQMEMRLENVKDALRKNWKKEGKKYCTVLSLRKM